MGENGFGPMIEDLARLPFHLMDKSDVNQTHPRGSYLCDVGTSSITANVERAAMGIIFSRATHRSHLSVMVLAPFRSRGRWAFLLPMASPVWLSLGATILIVPFFVFFFEAVFSAKCGSPPLHLPQPTLPCCPCLQGMPTSLDFPTQPPASDPKSITQPHSILPYPHSLVRHLPNAIRQPTSHPHTPPNTRTHSAPGPDSISRPRTPDTRMIRTHPSQRLLQMITVPWWKQLRSRAASPTTHAVHACKHPPASAPHHPQAPTAGVSTATDSARSTCCGASRRRCGTACPTRCPSTSSA